MLNPIAGLRWSYLEPTAPRHSDAAYLYISLRLLKMVVLPELSRPSIRILIYFFPTSLENNFEKTKPIIIRLLFKMSVKLNGMPSRGNPPSNSDRSKERIVEPQPTTKTSKVSQPVDVPKIPRPSSGIKPEQRKDNIPPQQPTKTKVLLSRA